MFNSPSPIDITIITILIADLLAICSEVSVTWTSPIDLKLFSNNTSINPLDRPITEEEESWIGSLMNIGAIAGALPFGFMAQKIGRKLSLLCVAIFYLVSYVIAAIGQRVYWFYLARLLMGMAVGGGYTVLPMYIAEISSDDNRGMLSLTLNVFTSLGSLIPYVVGPYVRIFWFNVILMCIPLLFLGAFIPIGSETPYYLMEKKRSGETEMCLKKLGLKTQHEINEKMDEIRAVLVDKNSGGRWTLFTTSTNLKALTISLGLILGQQLSGIDALLFYTEEIFQYANCDLPANISSIIIGIVFFVSSFLAPIFVDSKGRRILLLISSIGMVISSVVAGTYFYMKEKTAVKLDSVSWLLIVVLVVYCVTYNLGLGPIPWLLTSELFPINVKTTAAALTAITSFVGSFIVTKFFGDLARVIGTGGTFWVFAVVSLLSTVFIWFCVPETKGKSFNQIQRLLEK